MPHYSASTGVNLYYEDTGGGGPAVVLFPSTGLSLDVWNIHPVPDLRDRYRVITFDPRGIGRSKAPDAFLTIEQMAVDVADLLHHLGIDQAHLVGHSVGGRIALSLTLTYPGLARSLVMAASGSGSAIRAGEDVYPAIPHKILVDLVTKGLEAHVRREVFASDTFFTQEFRARNVDWLSDFFDVYWRRHADLGWYLRHLTARHIFEATHLLGHVAAPTLVLIGSADMGGTTPHFPASQTMAERIPNAELIVLDGQTHGFFWQQPDTTASVLKQWFDRH